jgi:hypothetical protein
MNGLLELLPIIFLATTPHDTPDAFDQIESALTSVGYYNALPKSQDDVQSDTPEKLSRLIESARKKFPFDLTPIVLDGPRPGFDNEWIAAANTTADALQHRSVRAMTLVPLLDLKTHPDVFVRLFGHVLKGKTSLTDFELPSHADIQFNIRVLLRYFQDFPRDFASN